MVFCPKCGQEVDDSDAFCKACGNVLAEEDNNEIENNNENIDEKTKTTEEDKLLIIPIILGVIGIIVGIVEGLSCPILFGWDWIIIEIVISILGGCGGLYLYKYKEEHLLAGFEFIITGIMMVVSISNMAVIGCTIFIIAGVSAMFIGRDFNIKNKTYAIIPILTLIIPLILLLILGGASVLMAGDMANQVSIDNVQNSIAYSYEYYSGSVEGDIHINRSFDYLELDVEYYDSEGKVLYSGLAWNQANAESGKTYHFSSPYFDKKQPVSAQITLKDSALSDEGFYVQNITLS